MVHKINKENEMQDIKINIMLEINKKMKIFTTSSHEDSFHKSKRNKRIHKKVCKDFDEED